MYVMCTLQDMVLPSGKYVEKVASRDYSDLAVEERRKCIEEARAARIAMRASASTSANTTQTASCSSGPCNSWRGVTQCESPQQEHEDLRSHTYEEPRNDYTAEKATPSRAVTEDHHRMPNTNRREWFFSSIHIAKSSPASW